VLQRSVCLVRHRPETAREESSLVQGGSQDRDEGTWATG
jgi:hypothetical protein